MFGVSQYRGRIYDFPDHNINPADKGAEWGRRYAQGIYSQFLRDRSGILYSKRPEWLLNRLYAEARQPNEQYMDIVCPLDPETHERKGMYNISWDNVSIAPKFRAIVTGLFNKIEHEITANAINEKADVERNAQKWNLWAEKKLDGFFSQFPVELNVQANLDELPGLPENIQELEMFKEMGSFKLKQELSIELLLKDSYYRSNWKDIKDKIYEDFFDLGMAAVKDYVDPYTKEVRAMYIDPLDLIVGHSRSKTYDNISHAGIIRHMTISQLRNEISNSKASNITEQQLAQVAQQYAGYGGNSNNQYDYEYLNYNDDNASHPYDEVTVDVLDYEAYSSDIINFEKKTRDNGEEYVYKQPYDYTGEASEKKVHLQAEKKTVYKGKWIIATELIYDYGLKEDVPFEDPKEPKLSIHLYKLTNKSMISQIISMINDAQLAILKIRNASAMAAPKGLTVEYGSLQNMTLGGASMDPLDILTIRRKQGDLVYKATTHHGQYNSGGSASPIKETEGGIGAFLAEQVSIVDMNINHIRNTLGISQPVDGSTPPAKLAVGVANQAEGAMNNVLQNLYKGYIFLKEETAKSMALRHQIVSRQGVERNVHERAVGGNVIKIVKIGSEISMMQMGIKLEARPSPEVRESVRIAAARSNEARKSGIPGIGMADYLFIVRQLENGNLKYAQMMLAYKEKKAEDKMIAQTQQAQQFARETAVVQERERQLGITTKINAEKDATIEVENTKSNNRIKEFKIRHEYDMELTREKGATETDKTLIKAGTESENVEKKIVSEEVKASMSTAATPVETPAPAP